MRSVTARVIARAIEVITRSFFTPFDDKNDLTAVVSLQYLLN